MPRYGFPDLGVTGWRTLPDHVESPVAFRTWACRWIAKRWLYGMKVGIKQSKSYLHFRPWCQHPETTGESDLWTRHHQPQHQGVIWGSSEPWVTSLLLFCLCGGERLAGSLAKAVGAEESPAVGEARPCRFCGTTRLKKVPKIQCRLPGRHTLEFLVLRF